MRSQTGIYDSILDTIGNTPLVRLTRLMNDLGLHAELLAKLEYFNPLASVKDRIGQALIDDLEQRGLASPDKTVLIEPTSGNTGIALAFAATVRGYRLILTMPESMSIERRKMLKLLGAELELTEAEKGMKGAIERAQSLQATIPNSVIPSQFENQANVTIHERTTAEEIWQDCDGKLDIFISGVGTGGTLTGVGKVLKERNPNIRVIAVEPEDSPVLSGGNPGPHKIQGIGAGLIPPILDRTIIDEVLTIANETAFRLARLAAKKEGIACGISSGAALGAAIEIIERDKLDHQRIVVVFPSFAERYLSTSLFEGL